LGNQLSANPSVRKQPAFDKIMRQIPEEERAFDLRYLIKSEAEDRCGGLAVFVKPSSASRRCPRRGFR